MASFTSGLSGTAQLELVYIGYFNRAVEASGYNYWANELAARQAGTYPGQAAQTLSAAVLSIARSFSPQSESVALYPFLGISNLTYPVTDLIIKSQITSFVTSVYNNLFGRAPDATGLAYWVDQIAKGERAGGISTSNAVLTIADGAGSGTDAQTIKDAAVLTNKIAVSNTFLTSTIAANIGIVSPTPASVLDAAKAALVGVTDVAATVTAATATVTAFTSSYTSTPGQTFTLTTGADNAGGAGNDTINGFVNTTIASTDSTLSAADTISGGAGSDTLKITVAGNIAGALPAAAITSVENFYIRDVNTGGPSNYDFSGLAGVQQVWSDRGTQNVFFDNLGSGVTVGLAGNGVATLGGVNVGYTGSVAAGSLAIDGGVGPVGTAAPIVVITGTGILSQSISSTGAANKIGTLGLAATTTAATISASTALTTGAVTAAALQKLTVSGAGAVDISAGALATTVTSIDASGSTGGLSVTVGASGLSSFTGGSAADRLLGSAAASAVGTYDGGAGTDTVSALMINAGNAAQFKSFEQIDIAGFVTAASDTLDLSLLTASTISGAVISASVGGANTATLSNVVETSAGFNVFVTDTAGVATGTSKLSFTSASVAGSSDVVNVAFKAADQGAATTSAAGTLSLSKIESLNITSGGGTNVSNSMKVTDDDLKSITITGNKDLTLEITGQSTSVASTIATQLASIDGSAATGKLSITMNAANALVSQSALAIKGGTADDTFVVVTSAAGSNTGASTSITAPTITGGAGNDTFDVTNATGRSATSPASVTITDFTKGDIIKITSMTAFASTKIDVTTASTIVDALTTALAATNTLNKASWFQYGGNTYVVDDAVTAGSLHTGDIVVKLTGLLDLSTSTFAVDSITFA